jgi:hypothetical protein
LNFLDTNSSELVSRCNRKMAYACAQQKKWLFPGSTASWNRSADRGGGGKGHGPSHFKKKSQLEPSRDGENMRTSERKPIPDVMKEDQ